MYNKCIRKADLHTPKYTHAHTNRFRTRIHTKCNDGYKSHIQIYTQNYRSHNRKKNGNYLTHLFTKIVISLSMCVCSLAL